MFWVVMGLVQPKVNIPCGLALSPVSYRKLPMFLSISTWICPTGANLILTGLVVGVVHGMNGFFCPHLNTDSLLMLLDSPFYC